jgi:hypothetical protein
MKNAEQLDDVFDSGADLLPHLDLSSARRPNLEQRRVNVDLPRWMIENLDREADRVGVTRQSIIKVWLAERLKLENSA